MPGALRAVIGALAAEVGVVAQNDELWVSPAEIATWLAQAGHAEVRMLAFDNKRYGGAQIGIHDPQGRKVGEVSHLRNVEHLIIAGPTERVVAAAAAATCGAS